MFLTFADLKSDKVSIFRELRQGIATFPDLRFAKVVANVSWFGHQAQGMASYRCPLKCQQAPALLARE
jgi:hypothetical protein